MRNTLKSVVLAAVVAVSVFASAAAAAEVVDLEKVGWGDPNVDLGFMYTGVYYDINTIIGRIYDYGVSRDVRVGGKWRVYNFNPSEHGAGEREFMQGEIIPAHTPIVLIQHNLISAKIVSLAEIKSWKDVLGKLSFPEAPIQADRWKHPENSPIQGYHYPHGVTRDIIVDGGWRVCKYPGIDGEVRQQYADGDVIPARTPISLYLPENFPEDNPSPQPLPDSNGNGGDGGGGCDSGMGASALLLTPFFKKGKRS